jgi:hypothetical protein
MFIFSHQWNAHPIYTEIPFCSSQNGNHQENKNTTNTGEDAKGKKHPITVGENVY